MVGQCTPGPWEFGERSDGSIWLSLGDPANGPHYQADLCASVADAKLIVAAKELLAACKAAKKYLEPDLVEPGRTIFWNLVAAISKAEGR